MKTEKRRRQRMIPPDFRDFTVTLRHSDLTMIGSLGNISEDGMLALIPGEDPTEIEDGAFFDGTIQSQRLRDSLTFRSRKVWSEVRTIHNQSYNLIGMQFLNKMELPDTLIAFELAAEILE